MRDRPPTELDARVLPSSDIARLFARASELDAAGGAGATVAELRAAAAEAGISAPAFEAALAEIQSTRLSRGDGGGRTRTRLRILTLAAAAVLVLITVGVTLARPGEPADPLPTMVEEAILLRCLSPGEAAELVRPLLRLKTNRAVTSPEHAPRVLKVTGTPEQLESVRALLNPYEGTGSSCGPV